MNYNMKYKLKSIKEIIDIHKKEKYEGYSYSFDDRLYFTNKKGERKYLNVRYLYDMSYVIGDNHFKIKKSHRQGVYDVKYGVKTYHVYEKWLINMNSFPHQLFEL